MTKPLIGFIGQGWIGKNYSDDLEKRGFKVVRYSLEEPFARNGEKIKNCDMVFIAVPTPTTTNGFDDSILQKVLKNTKAGQTVVIKSTLTPGTTEKLQKENPDIFLFHSPEFLSTHTAAYDTANPRRNIIGYPKDNNEYKERAKAVMAVLPKAPYELICPVRTAELIKYSRNCLGYFKVIFSNLLYDLVVKAGGDWEVIKEAMLADPATGGDDHINPIHKGGRGAGGECFIKDFAAFTDMYEALVKDKLGVDILKSLQKKNNNLLVKSNKDIDLLKGVYGEEFINNIKK